MLYVHGTSPADAANLACTVLIFKACSSCSLQPNGSRVKGSRVKHEKVVTSLQAAHGFLACRIEPIIMSAGELEHEWAGTPGRLIRERYRKAAEVSRVRPRLCAGVQFCEIMPDLQAMLPMSGSLHLFVDSLLLSDIQMCCSLHLFVDVLLLSEGKLPDVQMYCSLYPFVDSLLLSGGDLYLSDTEVCCSLHLMSRLLTFYCCQTVT